MGPGHFWLGGLWGFPWIFTIIIGVVAFCLIFRCRGFKSSWGCCHGGHDLDHGETPLEILKRRYAKGEITKEEFERIKKDLKV